MSSTKMAELIEIVVLGCGVWTQVDARKHVSDGGAHWSNLANTTELSICGSNAALCEILWFAIIINARNKVPLLQNTAENCIKSSHMSHSCELRVNIEHHVQSPEDVSSS